MAEPRRIHRYTYPEYVALERVSPERHEFLNGEIYTMAGGSREHARLMGRIVHLLVGVVGDGPCEAYPADLRIYVEAFNLATFPDACVICGEFQQHGPSPDATAVNPTVIVEVTSNSTEEYDLGLKREAYHTIASLREYVIVSHRQRRITIDSRNAEGIWTTRIATNGERFELPSLQTSFDVDEIYRNSTIS